MAEILVVDDDPIFCKQLELYVEKMGHQSVSANSLAEGLSLCRIGEFDIVFLDVNLPDISGLQGIGDFKKTKSSPEVIIITGDSDPDGAELALRNGAWYYMEKPLAYKAVQLTMGRALQFRENSRRSFEKESFDRAGIIGNDPKLRACLTSVSLAAKSHGNVLITGETGTGKELIARAIHINSLRKNEPFVVVDCTNIPQTLVESVLFGHEKGAFTDARKKSKGLVEQADKGTIFLDEVGDLPPAIQRSLLRVIQEKRFRPLGADKEREIDCRFVAATNCNLERMVADGSFRSDLYYRLATFTIHAPPLRSRMGDIADLVRHYADVVCKDNGLQPKGISTDYLDAMATCDWPGNVRELINVLHASIANAGLESTLSPHHLPMDFKVSYVQSTLEDGPGPILSESSGPLVLPNLKEFRQIEYDKIEGRYLAQLIHASNGKVAEACSIAGISRSRLYQLLRKYGQAMKD